MFFRKKLEKKYFSYIMRKIFFYLNKFLKNVQPQRNRKKMAKILARK